MNENKNLTLTVHILKVALILLIMSLTFTNFFLFNHSYEQFVLYIIEHYELENKEEKIKVLINKESYFLLKTVAIFLLTALMFLAIKINYTKIALRVVNNLNELKKDIETALKYFAGQATIEKVVICTVLFVFTAMQTYYLFKLPFTIDEAFSYVFFISKGFFVIASYYPGPNNHVLFSEVAAFFSCFIHNPVVSMRLPSLIASIVTFGLLFFYLQKKFGYTPATIATVFFCFSSSTLFYSIQGRGYALMSLFVLALLISLQLGLSGKKVYLYIFILVSVFGFYTIPVFLYPFMSFVVYALLINLEDKKKLAHLLLHIVLIGFFVIILYLPILLLNGINAITGNSWVGAKEHFFVKLPAYLDSVCDYLWSVENYGWIIVICLFLLFLFFSFLTKKKDGIVLISCAYAVPFIIITIQQTFPFERVWTYILIVQAYQIAFILANSFAFIKQRFFLTVFCIILSFCFIVKQIIKLSDFYEGDYANYYKDMNVLIDKLFAENPSSIFVTDDTYTVFLRYKYVLYNRAQPEIETESNKINKNYQYVLLPVYDPFPARLDSGNYYFFYKTPFIKAYFYEKSP